MSLLEETLARLAQIPELQINRNEPLSRHTRFAIGGPADAFAETASPTAFQQAVTLAQSSAVPWLVIGGGTNLVVADSGVRGIVLRFSGSGIRHDGTRVIAQSGAVLQDVVDYSLSLGLSGIHTMTGIPGWFGAAIYGNAGAYGRSIHQSIVRVDFFDGAALRSFPNPECEFRYRESIFKRRKHWIILSGELALEPGNAAELTAKATEIRAIRDAKYPPAMKCAGSIFKNLLFAELPAAAQAIVPPALVRDGKIPSAWFLEQTGVKGLRNGDIHVADYHANLIYNAGAGSSAQLIEVIQECKRRVRQQFGFNIEEEVQYVGF